MGEGEAAVAKRYTLIGLSDRDRPDFPPEVRNLIASHRYFAGGKRHYARIQSLLPESHRWIEISGDMGRVFQTLQECREPVAVFASGDPLYHGFAESLAKRDPNVEMTVYPHFHCLQVLCHRLNFPYQDLTCVSVHGRSWQALDQALIEDRDMIGILTDGEKSPNAIAGRMRAYRFTNYRMTVGECLEGDGETIRRLNLEEAARLRFQPLNCVILHRETKRERHFGIPDDLFERLAQRENMVTKMPVRLAALSRLALGNADRFWDIGFCTGSVSIEARLQFSRLRITAFEKRPECGEILERNARNLSAPGIEAVMGNFLEQDVLGCEAPDAVFIGGHGNRLAEVLALVHRVLPAGGRVVMNAVREESLSGFERFFRGIGYDMPPAIRIVLDAHNPIHVIAATKKPGREGKQDE